MKHCIRHVVIPHCPEEEGICCDAKIDEHLGKISHPFNISIQLDIHVCYVC